MRFNTDLRSAVVTDAAMLPLVLSPADVAAILGVSRNTTYELIHRQDFPKFKIGKQYRVPRDRFMDWLNTANGIVA